MSTSDRKKDHVEITSSGAADYNKSSGFEAFDFYHNALPEVDLDEIDLSTAFLGRVFPTPLFISSMTGGYTEGTRINETIARFCQTHNLPFGVGSMRAMLEDEVHLPSYAVVRDCAPDAFIAGNIGGAQLIKPWSDRWLDRMITSIRANAMIVHLNPLQELMQQEGDRHFKGIKEGIRRFVADCPVPVIVKETGAGISVTTAKILVEECGVNIIDIAGAGGTSWSKVENLRSKSLLDAEYFDEWGIPTADCLLDYFEHPIPGLTLISSGGIRSAHDVVKSLCLGAELVGMAGEVIKVIQQKGSDGLESWYLALVRHLKITCCLLGVTSINSLGMHHLRLKKSYF